MLTIRFDLQLPALPLYRLGAARLIFLDHLVRGTAAAITALRRRAEPRTPVDLGRLQAGYVERVTSSPTTIEGVLENVVPYALYVEGGTRPHWPPIGAIRGWAERHGINPYALQRSIARRGTPAVRFLARAVEAEAPLVPGRVEGSVRTALQQIGG
jgi:hypothetical protein